MKIKTNLWTGIIFGVISIALLIVLPQQVRLPKFDSGAPSPRIIPYVVIIGMLICSIGLLVQSLVLKKEDIFVFDIKKELPAIIILGILGVFTILVVYAGFLIGVSVMFVMLLYYLGERKPIVYIISVIGGILIYFLFLKVFNISLPGLPTVFLPLINL